MSFYRAIITVGGLTLGSRLLGFARDILTAAILGAGPVADAFFVALKLPNFFRRITAEGAFSVSFVPLFAGELEKNGKEAAQKFAEETQAVMFSVLVPFTVIVIVLMPWLLYMIAPGFVTTPERYQLALEMSRVTFPYIVLMSLTALLGGVMNSFDRFGPFAAAPMLFNISLMVALFFFEPYVATGGHAMAWGVALAGILQFGWLFYSCRRIGVVLKWRRPRITPMIRKLFKKMLPGALGAGLAQVNIFVDMVLASLLPVGAISFLYYADRLYQFPLAIIGTATGTALLPMLTRAIKSKDDTAAQDLFTKAFEVSLLLVLPATVAFWVMAPSIMQVLFERGAFTAEDSLKSAYALMAYSIGLPAFILSKIFAVAFYAREDTSTPVKIAVICAVMNTLGALALIYGTGLQHVGIALATGLTAWINIVLLTVQLKKKEFFHLGQDIGKRTLFIVGATLLMGTVLFLGDRLMMSRVMTEGQMARLLGLAGVMGGGAVVYGLCLFIGGVLKASYIRDLFPKRKKQGKIGDVREFGQ